MTNAMPSLQMTIKLSYGWRPFWPPQLSFSQIFVLFAAFCIDKFMKSAIMRACAEKSRSTRAADRRERAAGESPCEAARKVGSEHAA